MQTQYISEMLNLPDLQITRIHTLEREVHLDAIPTTRKQPCPGCHSDEAVIRKGNNGIRRVRHLSVFEKQSFLFVPNIRLHCDRCALGFSWVYSFIHGKQRYSLAFREHAVQLALGATSTHSAQIEQAPVSTVQSMSREALPFIIQKLEEAAWNQALARHELILGIDDFAIKKGHTYNTGIHDLRGELMLDLLSGRRLDDLRAYAQQHPYFLKLKPKAIVLDLAKTYHAWAKECFPDAIRIADRFHVQRYVIEAVQDVRKWVARSLAPHARNHLKASHRLLNPPAETLSDASRKEVEHLLGYSALLRSCWEWKEAFGQWYDYALNVNMATIQFETWCEKGERISHPFIDQVLKTMRNWQTEIVNYHACRWTNATVEGRHNRIKAFQRRHYFTRNAERYKAGVLIECNQKRLIA